MIAYEEKKYREVKKLAKLLSLPVMENFIGLELRDEKGRLIYTNRRRSHSWNRMAWNMMCGQMLGLSLNDGANWGAGYLTGREIDGTIRSISSAGGWAYDWQSGEGSTSVYHDAVDSHDHGIVVGSGTNAESIEDYCLQTIITAGSGAGQLNYSASEAVAKSYAALVYQSRYERYFNNNSGGVVDVNEVGLYGKGRLGSSYAVRMVARDVLSSTASIPDTGQLKVTYDIRVTFPA